MAQISTIKYSEIQNAHRNDAEYFKPEYLEIEKKINFLNHFYLSKKEVVSGPFGSTLKSEEYLTKGVYFIRVQDIKDRFFLETENMVCISEKSNNKIKNSELETGDLVISKVGNTIGLIARIDEKMKKANVSENNIGIKLKNYNEETKYFILTFLNSKYGQNQILRRISGNAQPKLNVFNFTELKIPILPQPFQLHIEQIVKLAHQKQTESKQLYREAEELLLTELGLLTCQVKNTLSFFTTKKEIEQAKRWDSEYFQPKYAETIEKIEKYDGGWDLVKNLFRQNTTLSKKDGGFSNYVEISDVNTSNGEIVFNRLETKDVPANGKRKLFKNDLLISKVRPYRGAISFIDFDVDNLLGSGAFTVLQEQGEYKKEVLMIFLKTIFIKELLLRYNCGTSYPVIKDEDILNLKIPLIKPSIQKQISEKIQTSHRLRKESKALLEEAKRKVEEEIEK